MAAINLVYFREQTGFNLSCLQLHPMLEVDVLRNACNVLSYMALGRENNNPAMMERAKRFLECIHATINSSYYTRKQCGLAYMVKDAHVVFLRFIEDCIGIVQDMYYDAKYSHPNPEYNTAMVVSLGKS